MWRFGPAGYAVDDIHALRSAEAGREGGSRSVKNRSGPPPRTLERLTGRGDAKQFTADRGSGPAPQARKGAGDFELSGGAGPTGIIRDKRQRRKWLQRRGGRQVTPCFPMLPDGFGTEVTQYCDRDLWVMRPCPLAIGECCRTTDATTLALSGVPSSPQRGQNEGHRGIVGPGWQRRIVRAIGRARDCKPTDHWYCNNGQ